MVLAVRVSLGREGLWVTEVWTLLPAGAFYVPQPGRDPPHVVTPLADPVTKLMGLWFLTWKTKPPGSTGGWCWPSGCGACPPRSLLGGEETQAQGPSPAPVGLPFNVLQHLYIKKEHIC